MRRHGRPGRSAGRWKRILTLVAAVTLACALQAHPAAGQGAEAPAQRILQAPAFQAARAHLQADHERIVREIIELTEIPAPPFKEERRAQAYLDILRHAGLSAAEMDREGNVMGLRRGAGAGPLLAVSAHLDTVFPEGTEVRVKREGTKLMAPGVGDNTRGLAVLLALIRALDAAGIQTDSDILFVGSVGEEGSGDLRGVKHLLQAGRYKDRIGMFVSIDGAGNDSITTGALGSRRYRITFHGPGGHSYGAFGMVNPAFALGTAVTKFSSIQVPQLPRTTFNVGVIGGGTSVNSIPSESWMEIDMRSESRRELGAMTERALHLMQEAAAEENRTRSTDRGKITVDIRLIGERPSGETPITSPIVRLAAGAMKAYGLEPKYRIGSTDSNIPISMGIPAITIGSGGAGGRAHALDEWIDVEKTSNTRDIEAILLILLSLAGMR